MSFEIYVSFFDTEALRTVPVKDIRERFKKHIKSENLGCWQLAFAEGDCSTEVDPGRKDPATGFAVSRPPDFLSFWEIIAGVLRDWPCVLYWPGTGAVIGSLEVLPHLPKEMIKRLGIPYVSTDPEQIRQYVWES